MTIAPYADASMPDFLQYLNDCKFILVSNREPYEHIRGPRGIEVRRPAGGLVSALDPTLRKTHGTWVAWGSGSADRESSDETGRVLVPPDEQSYTLRRVWLERNEIDPDTFAACLERYCRGGTEERER